MDESFTAGPVDFRFSSGMETTKIIDLSIYQSYFTRPCNPAAFGLPIAPMPIILDADSTVLGHHFPRRHRSWSGVLVLRPAVSPQESHPRGLDHAPPTRICATWRAFLNDQCATDQGSQRQRPASRFLLGPQKVRNPWHLVSRVTATGPEGTT